MKNYQNNLLKCWEESGKLRDEISESGFTVMDGDEGQDVKQI